MHLTRSNRCCFDMTTKFSECKFIAGMLLQSMMHATYCMFLKFYTTLPFLSHSAEISCFLRIKSIVKDILTLTIYMHILDNTIEI